MKKAIVFAGGGSKGAYQIGAWQALNEASEKFDIATGTSIGSINAAFYVQDDFEKAKEMWLTLTPGQIMENGINLDKSFDMLLSQKENLLPFVKKYVTSKMGADVTPFHDTIKKFFSRDRFFNSPVDYALITVRFPSMIPEEITKAEMRASPEPWRWIAASCACFPAFPVMEVDGRSYVDGGYYDRTPVASAFNLGAEEVTVIDLNPVQVNEGYISHPRVRYIKPSKDLGSFLNFESEVIDRSVRLGYSDTMKICFGWLGKNYTFIPSAAGFVMLNSLSDAFMTELTRTEAAFGFFEGVKFQRGSRTPGATTVIAGYLGKQNPTEADCFIAAVEKYYSLMGKDDIGYYAFTDAVNGLKKEFSAVSGIDYSVGEAFEIIERFLLDTAPAEKHQEIKKMDDRDRLIILSLVRTLSE